MKGRRTLLLACLMLIALGGGLFTLWSAAENPHPQKHLDAVTVTDDSFITKPLSLRDIPIYPDAQNQWKPYPDSLNGTLEMTRYKSSARIEEIVEFYKNALAQPGWEFKEEDTSPRSSPFLVFYWSDPQDEAPYQLDVSVSIRGDAPHTVELYLQRLSDPSKIPLYPGAMQSNVAYVPAKDEDIGWPNVDTRVTTYTSESRPSEIEQFYVTFLESWGWTLEGSKNPTPDNHDKSNSQGNDTILDFWYTYAARCDCVGVSQVLITTAPDTSGLTRVKIEARGRNITDPLHKGKDR